MELIDIIQKAEQMFFNFGIKSISMDDLSREMSISKKTLYTFVDSKDDLVYLVVQNHISREKEKSAAISIKSINAIDEFLQIILHNNDELSSLNKNVIYDLNKYHPKSWNLLTGFTEEYIFNHILQNLKRGVKEELYREDMNPELISFIYINSIDAILKNIHNKKTDKDIATTIKEYAIYHLHGIVSEKGRNYIHNNLKN
ncbi:MAG: TetR/AcrR family transcriptional regulator [Bacteroidota bacterium]